MSAVAVSGLPSPLSREQASELERFTAKLGSAELWWVSGYAAGLARAHSPATPPATQPLPDSRATRQLTIVYGSQTGNARRIAETLAQQAEGAGLSVRLLRADAYPVRELRDERCLYIVISTHGDGDPPDDARDLVEFLTGKRAPLLAQLKFAVLGLGDSSYPQFCAVGRVLDERLAELGATRLFARGEADLDFETVTDAWRARALATAREALQPEASLATVTPLRPLAAAAAVFTRERPFAAEVLVNQRISGRGSERDTRHVELSLEESNLTYEPGDALGVWPVNPAALVAQVLEALKLDGDRVVAHAGLSLPLRQWLSAERELTRLSRLFVLSHADRSRSETLSHLLGKDNAADYALWQARHQVIDLLRAHPAAWAAEELVTALRPLAPRLYSIASSRKAVGDEAHLTVAHVEYRVDGDTRWGAASGLLARADAGARLPVFIEANERFRLPGDHGRDVLMIGPGTGIAPFRGFLQERVAVGATGRNWLVFGNPRARSDFLYQLEWQRALKRGELTRLDLAFSRDREHKVYVQDRLRERGAELFAWLEGGAHLYVCGDATRMAKGVHAALIDIVVRHGGKSEETAAEYLGDLARHGRYARDVY